MENNITKMKTKVSVNDQLTERSAPDQTILV